jgi:hypothetical protein
VVEQFRNFVSGGFLRRGNVSQPRCAIGSRRLGLGTNGRAAEHCGGRKPHHDIR